MRTDLQSPMSIDQATSKHACRQCGAAGGHCGYDCVLSATCSLGCTACAKRNYWSGDLPMQRPWEFVCYHCGAEVSIGKKVAK